MASVLPQQVRATVCLLHMRVLYKLSLFCKPGNRDTVGLEGEAGKWEGRWSRDGEESDGEESERTTHRQGSCCPLNAAARRWTS